MRSIAAVSRADHRLPLRARARDADVDHGRRRARRAVRRADQERRSAGAHGKDRHARRRQDRHADRRQAEGDGRSCRPRLRRATTMCCGSPPASSRRANIRSARPSSRRRTNATSPCRRRTTSPRRPAKASPAWSTAGASCIGNARISDGSRHRLHRLWMQMQTRLRARRRDSRSIVAVDGKAGRHHRRRRPDQGDHAAGARALAGRAASTSSC